MTVNTSRPNFLRPVANPLTGQRLYLREDELDAGLAMILNAATALKTRTLLVREKHDVNWTQARTLLEVTRVPQGVSALSVALGLTKQATIKTIEEMVARDLVARTDDPKDRRRRTISVTPTGEAIARDIGGVMRAWLASAYRQVGGEAVAGCDAVLNAINRTLAGS
jgi:DNA-binding MarR family transcriptional regulator